MRTLIIFFFMFAAVMHSYSQISPAWTALYHPANNEGDEVHGITIDNAGNIYVTGSSYGAASQEDYATIKYSSSGVQLWVARYNGPANSYDVGLSIAVDNAGNVYVTGFSDGGASGTDIATVKYNSSGSEQWVQRYNGAANGFDGGKSIGIDGQSNVFVTGYSYNSATGSDIFTIKYNTNGVPVWTAAYDGPAHLFDDGISLALDNSGNIYTAGNSISAISSLTDYVTIKYNSLGIQQWASVYNGPANRTDNVTCLKTDNASNVYAAGFSEGNGTFDDYATVKYNSAGAEQWVRRYNGALSLYDRANSMAVDNLGNVYVTGYSQENGVNTSATTVKYNSSGVQQWRAAYNDSLGYSSEAFTIALDNSGSIYISGSFSYKLRTVKFNPAGVMQWTGGVNDFGTQANVMAVDGSGVYAAGSNVNGYLTVKFVQTVPGVPLLSQPPNDTVLIAPVFVRHRWFKQQGTALYRFQLALDSLFNNITVNDSSVTDTMKVTVGILPNTTYWWHVNARNYFGTSPWSETWKYHTGPIGIKPISSEIPGSFMLYSNYPNPFNPSTKIRFDIPLSRGVDAGGRRGVLLVIYDILGRETATIVNEQLNPGTYEVEWDASNMPSGIYFYRLSAGEYVNSRKMIVVK